MLTISNLTQQPIPRIPWQKIKKEVLGEKYNLSVVLTEYNHLKKLNREYRGKNKSSEVLSFSFSETEGEVFLNIKKTPRRLLLLFVHSLLHLKGLEHGKNLDKLEDLYYNKFNGPHIA